MKQEISCGFVLYKKSPELLFLLLKHQNSEEWDFPKGHQDSLETYYETAVRELWEEAQLTVAKDIIVIKNKEQPQSFTYKYKAPSGSLRKIILFAGQCTKNPSISSEHRGFAWCTLEEAKKMLKFSEVCACLEEIYHLMRNEFKDFHKYH